LQNKQTDNELDWEVFRNLTNPSAIQSYLDSLPYVGEDLNRSPWRVIQDQQCHCLDGGLLAAMALSRLGFPPRIIDLVPEPGTDDDHVLAVFQIDGCYGAVAKSNFAGLRYREPVYRSLRELVMSYFDFFYNVQGEKTLRAYTRPLNLGQFDRYHWQTSEAGVEKIVSRLYRMKPVPVINDRQSLRLSVMDRRSYDAGMLGVNAAGLYKPHSELTGG